MKRLTEAMRDLEQECRERGWPETICCPLDEVAASSSEFGSLVFKAVQDAGVRTYATKNPLAVDAAKYQSHVDVWCSQPFAFPYEKVLADREHEFWCYPNHNATERKSRKIMCKGGRMTYGFGFWRSGYTTLIPWHWAWAMEPDPFDYLRSSQSGSGQRIDEKGEIIPAVYWECFREGHDDARYVYTLQQALWERIGTSDNACQKEVRRARTILQDTWTKIDVQEKYLGDNVWPSSEFDARRWLIATEIKRLLKFPAHREGVAPSVFLDDENLAVRPAAAQQSVVEQAALDGQIDALDLGTDFNQWESSTKESSIEVQTDSKPPLLRWKIAVDHLTGCSADGEHLAGWPRIRRPFDKGQLDMTEYDFIEFVVQVDSDRDEVQDDSTILGVTVASHNEHGLYETSHDLGSQQRQEVRLALSIPEMIRTADKGDAPWKSIAHVQLFVSESNYPHGTSLRFDIKSVRLLRFKRPLVAQVDVPQVITLPQRTLPIPFEIMGSRSIEQGTHLVFARLVDSNGKKHSQTHIDPHQKSLMLLETDTLNPGRYRLDVAITTHDKKRIHKTSREVIFIGGPTSRD